MRKLLILLSALVCGTALHAASGARGSCEALAQEVKVGWAGSVRLVDEYDPDWKEFYGTGAYYLKVPLQKGHSYTVYMEGGSAEDLWMDAYAYDNWDGEVWPPSAGFFDGDTQSGKHILWMYSDDWDSGDPNTWNYFISLSGTIGASTTVTILEGIHSFLEPGLERNPKQITMKDTETTFNGKLTEENAYYLKANLTEGRKYLVRTTGGTAAKPHALKVISEKLFKDEPDPAHAGDKNNGAFAVYPEETGTFKFIVSGGVKGDAFGFVYRSVPSRTPDQHSPKTLKNGGKASFRPGPVVAETKYYDNVIDKNLFKVTMAKGERWVFDAVGADREVLMRLYDAKGNILSENTTIGNGSHNLRIGYEATKAGDYFVGVCDPELKPGAAAVCASTTLTARKVTNGDKTAAASLLPGKVTSDPVAEGAKVGPFTLSSTCWSQTFLFGGRKDQGYRFGTTFVDERSNLSLRAEAFKLSSTGKETPVELSLDDVTPGNVSSFTADANATYGVRISVMDNLGLDFPAFNFHAVAYSTTGQELGVLTVQMKGAAGQWTLDSEKEKYDGGVSLLLAGEHTVKFTTVKGYNITPRCSTGTVKGANWTGKIKAGKVATVVTGEYGDKFDPKDDVLSGASSLSISNKEKSNDRTLWAADPADWFKFSAKDGVYNNFRFDGRTGDSVMTVTDASGKAVSKDVTSVTSISKFAVPKGTYYLKVSHGKKPAQDGAYSLVASSVNVGAIKFAKTSVKVKDNVGQVVLTVNRTAKEGMVRVKYTTVNGTAKAGTDYVAQSGELVWKDGDKTKRTITITTLPDLIPTYRGKDRQFKVKLTPVAATGKDEYPAAIAGGDTATVTLTETAKKGVDPYKPAKKATGKEDDACCNGTFSGVAIADGKGKSSGVAQLANVSFTAKKDTLSAKVTIAGKSYSLSAKDGWDSKKGGVCTKTLVTKDGLKVTVQVADGKTLAKGDYLTSGGTVEFDFNGGHYAGELVRDNSKVQNYLDAVVDYVGYYTVSLAPQDGAKVGYGYVTLTVDNKGKAKLAGQLADGATKVSGSAVVAIRADGSLEIPVFVGKATYCFGGLLRLDLAEIGYGKKEKVPVVDSAEGLVWNDDKTALSGVKTAGWKYALSPVGGWFDTVINLQRYYYDQRETLSFDGVPVTLLSNNLTLPKKAAGQLGKDISFTFKRATGLVSGKLTYKGTASCKMFGVMLLVRDAEAPLDENIEAPGFFTRKVSGKIESVPLSILSESAQ